MTEVKTYCDRCGKEVIYSTKRKLYLTSPYLSLYLSSIGKEGGYDLCDSCYEELELWFKGKE